MNNMIDRIMRGIRGDDILGSLSTMSNADFNSFLIELYRMRSKNTTPRSLVKNLGNNPYVAPSKINPALYHLLEADLLSRSEQQGIMPILLSPVAPFGSCSAFGCVNQNNVISAIRSSEVLADPTNMLALLIADRQKRGELVGNHFSTTARLVRTQRFVSKNSFAHFGLFAIVSIGEDSGSYQCEADMIVKQLTYYRGLFNEKYNAKLSVTLQLRNGYTDPTGFLNHMEAVIHAQMPGVPVQFDFENTDNNYYKGINYKIYMHLNNETIEIGDSGFVDWMQAITGNKKMRCLISAISLDRLLLFA